MKALKFGMLAAILAGACLAVVGQAGARPHSHFYAMSARYGGADGRVDTLAKVQAFVRANRTAAQFMRAFYALNPRERRYVVREAFRIRQTVLIRGPVRVSRPRKGAAHIACVHPNYNFAITVGWQSSDFFGPAEKGITSWQWGGGCDNVVYARHQENGVALHWGVHYLPPAHYGAAYGQMGTHMVGREEFLYFDWNVAYINGQDAWDMQEQVNGCGYSVACSWWSWHHVITS